MNPLLCGYAELNAMRLEIASGSALECDSQDAVIVNAANEDLKHFGGIARQLVDSGGVVVQQESDDYVSQFGKLRHKQVAVTSAGGLGFKKILHVVGPIWNNYDSQESQSERLVETVCAALEKAQDLQVMQVVLPLISSNIYGFPVEVAASCHIKAFIIFSQRRTIHCQLQKVVLSLFTYDELKATLKVFFNFTKKFSFNLAKYLGFFDEQAMGKGQIWCQNCQNILEKQRFSIASCCRKVCDYCVFENKMPYCFMCTAQFQQALDYTHFLCRKCSQYSQDPFHTCRMICKSCYSEAKLTLPPNKCICKAKLS